MLAKTTQKLASLSQANFGPTALLIILIIFMSEELIPAEELDEALKRCPEWEAEGETITRTIEFEEYMEAIDFVNDLAEIVNEKRLRNMLAKTTQKLASLSQANFGPTALLIILIIFMSEELIPAEELDEALKRCPEWEAEGETITRTIEFEEYMEAIDFVNDLAEIVNEAQHFPEIDIRDLTVTIRLKTIDAGGVTDIDVELAKRIDTLVD